MKSIIESSRRIPVISDVDVVVAGGGPGGLPAAIASARHGAKTMLIERYGFLGGCHSWVSTEFIGSQSGWS